MNQAEINFWNKYYFHCITLEKFYKKNLLFFGLGKEAFVQFIISISEAFEPIIKAIENFTKDLVEIFPELS